MLYVDLNGQHLPVLDAEAVFEQNAVSHFDFSVVYREVIAQSSYRYLPAALYYNNTQVISGLVSDEPEFQIGEAANVLLRFTCFDELGRLACFERALPFTNYQEEKITDILVDLLNGETDDWQLGPIATMIDPDITTTIGLGNKEGRFAQVVELLSAVPSCQLRYHGQETGRYEIEIGALGDRFHQPIIQGDNLIELTRERKYTEVLRAIESIGGSSDAGSGGKIVIYLKYALDADPTLEDDPNFPIEKRGDSYLVVNVEIPKGKGCERKRDFSNIKAQDDTPPPTTTQLEEAGTALYKKTLREFQRQLPHTEYTVECFLDSQPRVGDQIYVQAWVRESHYNRVTGVHEPVEIYSVAEWLWITQVVVVFSEQNVIYKLRLTDQPYIDIDDSDIQVYEQTENQTEETKVRTPIQSQVDTDQVSISAGDPDCVSGGLDGKTFVIPVPAVPGWATQMYYSVRVTPQLADYEIKQAPDISGTNLVVCVTYPGGWRGPTIGGPQSFATVSAQFTFTA